MKRNIFLFILIGLMFLAGCKDENNNPEPLPTPPNYSSLYPDFPKDTLQQKQLIESYTNLMINAGFNEYAILGKDMFNNRKILFVEPSILSENYNAWANMVNGEIWLNKPMFTRYPTITHQATILFHELIHIKSTEATHFGPWWKDQDVFAAWCKEHYPELYQ